jgi:hypothetical protein
MKTLSAILLIAGFTIGCAHTSFTPVTTSNGSLVREDATLPIYYSAPTVPYDSIGIINVETARIRNPDKIASQQGIARGANALILINEGTETRGHVNSTFVNAQNFGNTTTYQGTTISTPVRRKFASYMAIRIQSTNNPTPLLPSWANHSFPTSTNPPIQDTNNLPH